MNQKICIAVLFVTFCLCLTSALPTYGLSFGLGQQYPRSFGFGNPYAGSIGGVASVDPVYSNGFGNEYGSRYGSYSASPYNRYGGYGASGYGASGYGGSGYGGVGVGAVGAGFEY
ncbi:probable peroxisomal membrane protein PEX13 [Contarinia nasturtii]|uniref:probable peroxisomal membrane protein PEX13 n=1 Tax=Contarinia nasturtii TaxID=265458 RepID=UPI0012D4A3FB|nr:probable peroxisomal membrane protein PEX13 [Contarinia nasturtii]